MPAAESIINIGKVFVDFFDPFTKAPEELIERRRGGLPFRQVLFNPCGKSLVIGNVKNSLIRNLIRMKS